jgi:uncharacterized protein involved in exopolysaccharide biosynthesis
MLSEMSAFDLGLSSGLKSNVDNEIEILKSRTLVQRVVKKLNLNTSLVEGRVIDTEIYEKVQLKSILWTKQISFMKVK